MRMERATTTWNSVRRETMLKYNSNCKQWTGRETSSTTVFLRLQVLRVLFSTVNFNFDLCDSFICPIIQFSWCRPKFDENSSRTFQDIVLTMFGTHARKHGRTNALTGKKHNSPVKPPITTTIKLAIGPARLARVLQTCSPHLHNSVRVQYYAGTCNLRPITAYRPLDGISPLSGQPLAVWTRPWWQASRTWRRKLPCNFYCSSDTGSTLCGAEE